MYELIGDRAFKIDNIFVDLNALHRQAQLLGDGKKVHDANCAYAVLNNYHTVAKRRGVDALDDRALNAIRGQYAKLAQLLSPVRQVD